LQLESKADEEGNTFFVFLPTIDGDKHIKFDHRQ
jgi:hypothetical protein